MLTDYQTVKQAIGIPNTDTSQDAKIQLLTVAADATVKSYCKRLLETGVYTWYPPQSRCGGTAIVVEETPLLCYTLNGNVAQGQNTITGLSSTSNLLVGMTAILTPGVNNRTVQPFTNAATITAVGSTSVTLSGSGAGYGVTNGTFLFGLSVWFDPLGSNGLGPGSDPSGPYPAQALLYPGLDFTIQRDQPDGTSKSGIIKCLASTFALLGMAGPWQGDASAWGPPNTRGTLSGPLPPLWPKWPPGSIRVMYAAGYGTGATPPTGQMPNPTTIPADLTMATTFLAVWMWRNADTGGMLVTNESYQGYSSGVAPAIDALKSDSELGSIRQILSRYRKVAI